MTLGITISLLGGAAMTCFGLGWLTAHWFESRQTRPKDRPR